MDVRHCLVLLAALMTSQVAATDVPRSPPRIQPPAPSALPAKYFKPAASFTLPCTATGDPPPTYRWTLNGKPLTVQDPERGDHTVNSAYRNDEGDYQCIASNQWGDSMSPIITVQLARQGSFPADKTVTFNNGTVGQPLRVPRLPIHCVPTPKYDWKKIDNVNDDEPETLKRSKRILQDIEGNLYFTSLKPEDDLGGDLYKVEVYNHILDSTLGGSYTKIQIDKSGPVGDFAPELLYPESSHHKVTVVEGDEMRVQCIFSGRPAVNVSWSGPDSPKMTREEAGTRLRLHHVTQADAGTYKCKGINAMGTKSATIQVKVHTLPKFDNGGKPEDHSPAITGDSVSFNCQYSPDTKPVPFVTWMRNGVEITKGLSDRSTLTGITRGKRLTMTDLQSEDTGVIQCKLFNEYGTVYAEATLNVFMKTTITVKPVSTWLEPNKTEVKFECGASSDPDTPKPNISWLYKGEPLESKDSGVRVEGGTVRISLQGTASDMKYIGKYICKASDGFSHASHTATLYATKEEQQQEVQAAMIAEASSSLLMLVGVGAALFLLLLLVLAAVIKKNRQKGQTYHSEKRERKVGINPLSDRDRLTFVEYQRRPDRVLKASNASIRGPPSCGSDAGDSVAEYGDLSEGKFNEEGSFIGIYSMVDERDVA